MCSPVRPYAVAAVLLFIAAPAVAQITTNWTNTTGSGNMVHIGTNWDNGVPTSVDMANFNQKATYFVNFSFSTLESNTLNVTAGDVEFFSGLANQTYFVGSDVLIDDSALTLDNVNLDVRDDFTMQNGGLLTVNSDAAIIVGNGASLEGTVNNDGDIELQNGVLLTAPNTNSVPSQFDDADFQLKGVGRVFVSGVGNTATIGMPPESHLDLLHSGDHTLEAINGGILVIEGVHVDQFESRGTVHAGDGSVVVLRGDASDGPASVTYGHMIATGDGEFFVEVGNFFGTTIDLSSAGQLIVPPEGTAVFDGGVAIIVDSESQLIFSPFADIHGGRLSLQINGDHELVSGDFLNTELPIFRLFGNQPSIEEFQSLIIAGTMTLESNADLNLVGGTFTTGALMLQASSELILASGTFNLTNSDLELGTGMPFRTEIQAGSTNINVTNGDVITLADGVLNTNGNLTAQELDNAGQVGTIGGSMAFSGAATNQATGQINAINAELNFDGGLTNNGQLNVINTTVSGAVNSPEGSSITVANAATFNGDVSGGADFDGGGTTTFNALYAPGDSPDSIDFAGSLNFGSGATLGIEIGGLFAGADFDRLVVAGDVTLDGTLDVTLISPFTLQPGQSFEIVDVTGSLSGTFSGLPDGATVGSFGGTELVISYLAGDGNDVALLAVSGIDGDYSNNGVVDAADYVLWRMHVGADEGTLLNDADGGQIGTDQYNTWKANFGITLGSGSLSGALVPEPESLGLLLLAAAAIVARCLR